MHNDDLHLLISSVQSMKLMSNHKLLSVDFFSTIYAKLASAFTEEQQAIYQQRVDEIAPNLRYCAYNIGDESALLDLQKMRVEAEGDQLSSKLDVSSEHGSTVGLALIAIHTPLLCLVGWLAIGG